MKYLFKIMSIIWTEFNFTNMGLEPNLKDGDTVRGRTFGDDLTTDMVLKI